MLKIPNIRKPSRRVAGQIVLDAFLIQLALLCAWALRHDFNFQGHEWASILVYSWPRVLLYLLAFSVFHLYRLHWRYFGLRDAVSLATATILAASIICVIRVTTELFFAPVSVLLSQAVLAFVFVGALRVALRVLDWPAPTVGARFHTGDVQRLLIVGAGDAGEQIARDLLRHRGYRIVGFVDDDPAKQNQRIHGIAVLGTSEAIPRLVEERDICTILIAIPSATGVDIRRIFTICRETPARIQVVPGLTQIVSGNAKLNKFREVSIEDLLRRPPIEANLEEVVGYIRGQRVLVTGAGGSIGSELCRQIALLNPSLLILLGHGENSIFEIHCELKRRFPDLQTQTWIADIKDRRRLERAFQDSSPTVVFHTAAHKHVPLMEFNIIEAVRNNVIGTRNVVELAIRHGVRKCVFISTDKAVSPSSVMGATKRICEFAVRRASECDKTTGFAIVRFGNVLGSRGSVIPTMKRQIDEGGPVTVTHPEMKRFFMTIPEAVQLVLQAAAMGGNADVFVLDMGEPVRILELARDLIRLSGYVPDVDIPIKFTGMRPGEKLEERLFTESEETFKTSHPKISVAHQCPLSQEELEGIDALLDAADAEDEIRTRALLMELAGAAAADEAVVTASSTISGPISPVGPAAIEAAVPD